MWPIDSAFTQRLIVVIITGTCYISTLLINKCLGWRSRIVRILMGILLKYWVLMVLVGIILFVEFSDNINLSFCMHRLFLVDLIFKLPILNIHFQHFDDAHLIVSYWYALIIWIFKCPIFKLLINYGLILIWYTWTSSIWCLFYSGCCAWCKILIVFSALTIVITLIITTNQVCVVIYFL